MKVDYNTLANFIENGIELYPAKETGQPLRRYTENPGIKTIDGLKEAIKQGFKRFVFVPCRGQYICFDLDRKNNRDGVQSIVEYCKKNNIDYKQLFFKVPFTKTPRNGLHLYFKYNGEPVLNNEILPGVEVKHANLITAPGSVTAKGIYILHGDIKAAPSLPSILQALLLPRNRKEPVSYNTNIINDISLERIESVLMSQGHTPTPGARNRYIFKYGLYAAKQGKDRDTVTGYLLKYSSPDFTAREITQAIKSAYRIRGL